MKFKIFSLPLFLVLVMTAHSQETKQEQVYSYYPALTGAIDLKANAGLYAKSLKMARPFKNLDQLKLSGFRVLESEARITTKSTTEFGYGRKVLAVPFQVDLEATLKVEPSDATAKNAAKSASIIPHTFTGFLFLTLNDGNIVVGHKMGNISLQGGSLPTKEIPEFTNLQLQDLIKFELEKMTEDKHMSVQNEATGESLDAIAMTPITSTFSEIARVSLSRINKR